MLKQIHLHELNITGINVKPVSIPFGKRLTIITGGSDSGKTYLYNLINYLFGTEKLENSGFDEEIGYDTAYIEFSLGGAPFTISRSLVDNSDYKLYSGGIRDLIFIQKLAKSNNSKNSFYSLFYKELLFKSPAKVRTNQSGTTNKVNLGTITRFFCIDEIRILTAKSLILSDQHTESTKGQSEFKFLITQRDDSNLGDEKPNKKAKQFLKTQVSELIEEITKTLLQPEATLLSLYNNLDELDIKKQALIEEQYFILDKSNNKFNDIDDLKNEISFLQQRKSYLSMLIERFSILEKCYISDLQRIDSISQANFFLENFSEELCEHCNHPLKTAQEINYDKYHQSCLSEAEKINRQLSGLKKSIQTNKVELNEIQESLSHTNQRLDTETDEYHKLRDVNLKKLQEEIEIINDKKDVLLTDIAKLEIINKLETKDSDIDNETYNPDEFDKLNYSEITVLIDDLKVFLDAIKFNDTSDNKISFCFDNYDFVLNEKSRKLFGKGSRSIVYAGFVISLSEFLAREKKPHLGFVLLDSPLVTHFDKKREIEIKDINPTTLTDAFYKHIINSKFSTQVILLENKGPTFKISNDSDIILLDLNKDGNTGLYPLNSPSL
ncbi:hypothetical protein [Aeromonas veronii]